MPGSFCSARMWRIFSVDRWWYQRLARMKASVWFRTDQGSEGEPQTNRAERASASSCTTQALRNQERLMKARKPSQFWCVTGSTAAASCQVQWKKSVYRIARHEARGTAETCRMVVSASAVNWSSAPSHVMTPCDVWM